MAITGMILLLGTTTSAATGVDAFVRTHDGGGVQVKAVYAPPEYFTAAGDTDGATRFQPDTQIVFLLSFDTHSLDLSLFDVAKNSRLVTSAGKAFEPVRWEATREGSHHRAGGLIFARTADGVEILGAGITSVNVIITNLAGVPSRSFTWPVSVP
jgi:hypothetical protein